VNLRSGSVLRIGHRGAAALAPENTLRSIEVAIDLGVDLVEIDVVEDRGRLRLAHDASSLTEESPLLEEALELLAERGPGVLLDLKSSGVEGKVVALLRTLEIVDRSVVASFHVGSLRAVKDADPTVTTGFSYPFDRAGLSNRWPFRALVAPGLAGLRRTLPSRVERMLASARADAALLHWRVVSGPIVERCHARDAAVLAWTVEDDEALQRVLAAGVDGVIANDPRLPPYSPRSASRSPTPRESAPRTAGRPVGRRRPSRLHLHPSRSPMESRSAPCRSAA
jgi:glycerophosphoryl diester phosphodiesterase